MKAKGTKCARSRLQRPEIWDARKGCYRKKYWRELTEAEEQAEIEFELAQNRQLRKRLHYK